MGGPSGGDGGFIEVSGKQYLAFEGEVSTNGPLGKTGTLLLDPTDIFIVPIATGRPLTPSTVIGTTSFFQENPGAVPQSEIISGTLGFALAASNVIINTTRDFPNPPLGGSIINSGGFLSASSNDITFIADGNITFFNSINAMLGSGNIYVFTAGDVLIQNVGLSTGDGIGNGTINIGSPTQPVGNLSLQGTVQFNTQAPFGGDINFYTSGDMTLASSGGFTLIQSGGNITADIGGNLSFTDGTLAGEQSSFNSLQTSNVTVGGNITFNSSKTFTRIDASNGLNLSLGGNLVINGFGATPTGLIASTPTNLTAIAGGSIHYEWTFIRNYIKYLWQ